MSTVQEMNAAADAHNQKARMRAVKRRRKWTGEAVLWAILCLSYLTFGGPYTFSQADWTTVFLGGALIPLLIVWGASIFHRMPPDL